MTPRGFLSLCLCELVCSRGRLLLLDCFSSMKDSKFTQHRAPVSYRKSVLRVSCILRVLIRSLSLFLVFRRITASRAVTHEVCLHVQTSCLCFCAAGGRFSSVSSFKVMEGGVASLSCQYSVQRFGLSRVCWGRGCGTFWCSNILVQTDENGAVTQV